MKVKCNTFKKKITFIKKIIFIRQDNIHEVKIMNLI